MDPFHAFANYPSAQLTAQSVLALSSPAATAAQRVAQYRKLAMVNFAAEVLPTEAELQEVLNAANTEPRPAIELVKSIDPQRRAQVLRALVWLVKLGVLKMPEMPEKGGG